MRLFWAVAVALLVLAGQATAATLNFNLFRGGGNGSVTEFTEYSYNPTFVLAGSNSYGYSPVDTRYLALAPEPWGYPHWSQGWQVTGNWTYLTQNWSPHWDSFGFVINGVKTQLSNNWGSTAQAGSFSFFVRPGDVFGWYVTSLYDCCGRAIATVSANVWESYGPHPIPLPAPALLMLAGLGALAGIRRRRQRPALA